MAPWQCHLSSSSSFHHNRWLPLPAASCGCMPLACHGQLDRVVSARATTPSIHKRPGPCIASFWVLHLGISLSITLSIHASTTGQAGDNKGAEELSSPPKRGRPSSMHGWMQHHHLVQVHANQCKPKAIRSTSRSSQHN